MQQSNYSKQNKNSMQFYKQFGGRGVRSPGRPVLNVSECLIRAERVSLIVNCSRSAASFSPVTHLAYLSQETNHDMAGERSP